MIEIMVSGLPDFLLPRTESVFKQTDDDGLVKAHALAVRLFANSFGNIGRETSQRTVFIKPYCAALLQHYAS